MLRSLGLKCVVVVYKIFAKRTEGGTIYLIVQNVSDDFSMYGIESQIEKLLINLDCCFKLEPSRKSTIIN